MAYAHAHPHIDADLDADADLDGHIHAVSHLHAFVAVIAFARSVTSWPRFPLSGYFVLVSGYVVWPELYAGPNYG
jgi:hypothetical protein